MDVQQKPPTIPGQKPAQKELRQPTDSRVSATQGTPQLNFKLLEYQAVESSASLSVGIKKVNSCLKCSAHEDSRSDACHLASGACGSVQITDPDRVDLLYVRPAHSVSIA